MTLRAALGRVHRWLGFGLGLYLAAMGLTGSLLVYADEIATPAASGRPDFAAVVRAHPAASRVRFNGPGRAWTVRSGRDEFHVNPSDGRVLAPREPAPLAFAKDLHTNLTFGKSGRAVSAWIGLGAFWLLLTGILVWWPRTRGAWRHRTRIAWDKGTRRRIFDLHAVGGAYAAIPLVFLTVTGVGLAFGEPVERLFGLDPKPAKVAPSGPVLPPERLLALAEAAAPGRETSYVFLPRKPGETFRVLSVPPGGADRRERERVALDPATGALVRRDPPRSWETVKALHFGTWAGVPHRWSAIVVGLVPLMLGATGAWSWWRRRAASRERSAR